MRLCAVAFLVLASLPATASQIAPRRDPPPEARRLEARDGDVIVVENDDRVRVVRRRVATARVVVDDTRSLVIVLADFAPAGGQPDGLIDRTWRYIVADGRWPLEARWDGPVTIEEEEWMGGRSGSGLSIETPSGLVVFDNGPPGRTDLRGAIAVLRFQSFAGGGPSPSPLTFDQSERQQLSDTPPTPARASFGPVGGSFPGPGVTWGGVAVAGSTSATLAAAPGQGGAPLRVGGGIRMPRKIHHVDPVMPQTDVQGIVILELTLAADGTVQDARVLRSIPPLDQAAIDAARQWRFEPTMLGGQAVPVILTVTVQFTRGR